MDSYKVSVDGDLTIIEQVQHSFKMSVQKNRKTLPGQNTAILEATLYREEGVFVKDASFVFEAIDDNRKPLSNEVNINDFTAAVDFFFTSILGTEHYVRSIPRASCFCPAERKLFPF